MDSWFFQDSFTKGYCKREFLIDDFNKINDGIKISWENNYSFFMFFLYAPNKKLCCQVVTKLEKDTRLVGFNNSITSPCCISLDSSKMVKGQWVLEVFVETDKNIQIEFAISSFKEIECKNYFFEDKKFLEKNIEDYWISKKHNEPIINLDLVFATEEKCNRWYAGDFHTHTIFSDGSMSREENTAMAKQQGLDFFIPTDHNVVHTGWPTQKSVTVIPGTEITSPLGHLNALFTEYIPFASHSIVELADKKYFYSMLVRSRQNSVLSINHPFMFPWEFRLRDYPLDQIKVIETINDPTYKTAEKAYEDALIAWTILLNDGYKITAIGGSDSHNRPDVFYKGATMPSLLGGPKTWVYATGNSLNELKAGVLNGAVVVSRNQLIEFSFNEHLPGSSVNASGNIELEYCVHTLEFNGEKLICYIIKDGDIIFSNSYTTNYSLINKKEKIQIEIDENYHWCRLDVRTESGKLFGFTNPIYFNLKNRQDHKFFTWGEIFDLVVGGQND